MARLPSLWEEPFKLASNLGSLFDRMDNDFGFATGYGRTDIYEKDGNLHYDIELPGVKKDDINARIEDRTLVVEGEIKKDDKVNNENFLRMERRYGQFQKSFRLPEEVKSSEGLKACFEDGVLKISVPLRESMRSEVVDIDIE